jgi:hypothetical protein
MGLQAFEVVVVEDQITEDEKQILTAGDEAQKLAEVSARFAA